MKLTGTETRLKVVEFFRGFPTFSQKKIAEICKTSTRTVRRAFKEYKLNIPLAIKKGNGRKGGPNDKILEDKVLRKIQSHRNMSVRDLALKCKTSKTMIQREKARNNLKTYVKQKQSSKTIKQYNEGIKRAQNFRRLLRGRKNFCIIEDDETYVKWDFSTLPGKQFYSKSQSKVLPEEITTVSVEKFGKKTMIWQAICECDMRSAPYIVSGTLTSEIYPLRDESKIRKTVLYS